jgi:predicted amidohydrolase YtcJ
VKIISTFAAAIPDRECLDSYQLMYNAGPDHAPLTRQHLDTIVANRPVIIIAYDGHTAWANTLALERAQLYGQYLGQHDVGRSKLAASTPRTKRPKEKTWHYN